MARGRPKKTALIKNASEDESHIHRRSSLKVNLSYVSNLSDSGFLSKKPTIQDDTTELSLQHVSPNVSKVTKTPKCNRNNVTSTPSSSANVTVINVGRSITNINKAVDEVSSDSTLSMIKKKEELLNKSCENLKNAIMSKTKAIFDSENELAIKITEVLEPGHTLHSNQSDDEQDLRSPSIRVNLGKNDQIIMSGDGRKKNPVQVNTMQKPSSQIRENNPCSQSTNGDDTECRSIASTPKMSTIKKCNKSSHKSAKKILRVPVARLFADDNDNPNNSLSDINPIQVGNNLSKSIRNDYEQNLDNVSTSEKSSELNYTTSPILSQGNRKARISRLSLKKKVVKTLTETKTNESFLGRKPLTCSSFLEKQDTVKNKNMLSTEISKPLNSEEKNRSNCNGETIDLGDEKITRTIVIDNSSDKSSSIMDITGISSIMPIVRRSFQQIIRRSLNLDDVTITENAGHILNSSSQKQMSVTTNKNKEDAVSKSLQHLSKNPPNDCTTNIELISLNVNTSLDPINSDDNTGQKENKKPNNSAETSINSRNQESENNTFILRQSSSSTGSSKDDPTRPNSEKKSVKSNFSDKEKNKINKKSKNQEKDSDSSVSRPSTSTARSSLQVNTSFDSLQKPSIPKNDLDYNKLLSMVEENSINEAQSKVSEYSENQSFSSNSKLENVSLMERIRNISKKNPSKKSTNSEKVNERKSKSLKNDCNTAETCDDGKNTSSTNKQKTVTSNKKLEQLRKSKELKNMSNNSSGTETSVVETTPFPASRSFLLKTIIKNSIATNTLNPRKFVDFTDDEGSCNESQVTGKKSPDKNKNVGLRKKTLSESSSDTVILDSPDELHQERERVIIEESLSKTQGNVSTNGQESQNKQKSKKISAKRKLYPLRENSQISFSAMVDMEVDLESHEKEESEQPKQKKNRRVVKNKKIVKKISSKNVADNPDGLDKSLHIEKKNVSKNVKKVPKKPRKIVSKKIVVKKANNMSILDDLIDKNKRAETRLSNRNSLNEFDLRKRRFSRTNSNKRHKINIVVTGLSNEDKSLVKTVIKTLGSAVLETNVTPRTTHVVSAGTRTINLLKGIIRGCWLLSMEWVLKSLESEQWLEPGPYEMVHFSKAVQENRRDRQLFGKAYVPELFVTCGFIYIENGTSPPAAALKELVKTAGGRITENPDQAQIEIGSEGLKENWILDSITTGELQPADEYKRS